ncbi:cap binding protein 80-pb, partial [Moniliophthora roreri]
IRVNPYLDTFVVHRILCVRNSSYRPNCEPRVVVTVVNLDGERQQLDALRTRQGYRPQLLEDLECKLHAMHLVYTNY